MYTSRLKPELDLKKSLTPSEYTNLFGDPFWTLPGNSKAKSIYWQMDDKQKAEMLKANYIKMIEKGRQRNWDHAADNLQWWLDGSGFTKIIDFKWLRSQREVLSSENLNIKRFENDEDLKDFVKEFNDGYTDKYVAYFVHQVKAGIFGELFYMSGYSILNSRCNFKITRKKNDFLLSGTIVHSWSDRYDWHKGAHAYIYGFGYVGDSDALLVEKHCGAKPFDMKSTWKQNFKATFQIESSGSLNLKLR